MKHWKEVEKEDWPKIAKRKQRGLPSQRPKKRKAKQYLDWKTEGPQR